MDPRVRGGAWVWSKRSALKGLLKKLLIVGLDPISLRVIWPMAYIKKSNLFHVDQLRTRPLKKPSCSHVRNRTF